MSTVRAVRMPTPSAISPFSSRSRAPLRIFISPTRSLGPEVSKHLRRYTVNSANVPGEGDHSINSLARAKKKGELHADHTRRFEVDLKLALGRLPGGQKRPLGALERTVD